MNEQQIIVQVVTSIFNNADKRQWNKVREHLHFEVYHDYFTLNKKPGEKIKAEAMVTGWSDYLPRFHFTHHVLTNFEVAQTKETAHVHCKGSGMHFLKAAEGGETWTTIGTYEIGLLQTGAGWKVNSILFNLLFEEGNKLLPTIAHSRANSE